MPLIPLNEAASRLGIPEEKLEEWVQRELLSVHERVRPSSGPPERFGFMQLERCVDEDELADVAESMGWLELSEGAWDSDEDQ